MVDVVRKGDDADGFTITTIGAPMLAHDGTIAFSGQAGTSSVMQYTGVVVDPVDLIVKGGTAAPGGGNFNNNLGNQRYSEGEAAVLTSAGGLTGIWTGGPGTLAMLAKQNEIAPGFGTATYNNAFDQPRINEGEEAVFADTVSGGGVTPASTGSGSARRAVFPRSRWRTIRPPI